MPQYNPSVFLKDDMLIVIYVDDMLVAGATLELITGFKKTMKKRFEMTDVGVASFFLNIRVTARRNSKGRIIGYTLSQEHYLQRVLEQHDMLACAEAPTPLDRTYTKRKPTEEEADSSEYRSIVGQIMYIYLGTRLDAGFAISHLSQFFSDPSKVHTVALKRLLRYLKSTISLGLHLGTPETRMCYQTLTHAYGDICPIYRFTDADWASDKTDRCSVSAYQFFIRGSLISWTAKKQTFVATSTMESEYVAAAHGAKEAVCLRSFIDKINAKSNLRLH